MNNWFLIVRKSFAQHALSTFVTVLSIALATGLATAVFAVSRQSQSAFKGEALGFDAVLGARGSELQLVLNTVFHLETSPGNIPFSVYQELRDNPRIQLAIPYALGDNYRGFRIVGTTTEIFTKFEYHEGKQFKLQQNDSRSRFFKEDEKAAVVGASVARECGLNVGDVFHPSHGMHHGGREHKHDDYLVVGIMEPTNTPSDRVIFIPIDGIFHMEGHVLRGTGKTFVPKEGEAVADEHKEVSAVMLKFSSPRVGMSLKQRFQKGRDDTTLAWPLAQVVDELFHKMGWISLVLQWVAYLTMFVAAASLLASLHNTMNERSREFALMRALGARRLTVFGSIVLQSTCIAVLGVATSYICYFGLMKASAWLIQKQTGVLMDPFRFDISLLVIPLIMIAMGCLSGLIPAWKAYRTDVATNLSR